MRRRLLAAGQRNTYGTKLTDSIISPQLATPRRSLFSSNLLGQANGRGMDGLERGVFNVPC